jgi:N-acetylmuramoyl-L-alanine amidase
MRTINKIIVHCSATAEGHPYTVSDIDAWHRKRGFRCIGYHHVIYLDGTVHAGRPEAEIGAHCLGQNANSIGICYIGGCAADGKTAKDTRTPAQKTALTKLLTELRARYPQATIHGHRDYAAKACPSFDATAEYANL